MTEQQQFELVERHGPVEIRRYAPCVMADVEVNAEYASAGNIGFGPLVRYISQNNIAMTAPVIQEQSPHGSWIVSFVMPSGMVIDDLPNPSGGPIRLRPSPEFLAAVLPFSGHTTEKKVKAKERQLADAIPAMGYRVAGSLQIARFDPPWKPGFARRNEVLFPVEK